MRPHRKYALSLALLAVVIAAVSVSIPRREPAPDYGRLMKNQIARNDDIRRQPPPVIATPVTEQPAADPLLVLPAAREQEFLSVEPVAAPPPSRSSVNIVGNSSGITIVRSADAPKRPLLAGGIFKQQ
jgi:hypothetical protein